MKLCEKLYELRRAAGLSQEELAEKLSVSRQAVSKWENGAAQPELSKLVELSRLYGVSVDELLSLEEAEKSAEDAAQTPAEPDTPPAAPTEEKAPNRHQTLLRGAVAACLLLSLGLTLYNSHRVSQLEGQVNSLRYQISSVQSDLSGQIASISNSVRNALEEGNARTGSFDYEVKTCDINTDSCTLTFSLQPKTVTDQLTVSLNLAYGDRMQTLELARDEFDRYCGTITLPLVDEIAVTAVYDLVGERWHEELSGIYNLRTYYTPALTVVPISSYSLGYADKTFTYRAAAWEDAESDRGNNLKLGAYSTSYIKSAYLEYRVDGEFAARSELKISRYDSASSGDLAWWPSELHWLDGEPVYSLYGWEGAEFTAPYGASIESVVRIFLANGTVLSAPVQELTVNSRADAGGTTYPIPYTLTAE